MIEDDWDFGFSTFNEEEIKETYKTEDGRAQQIYDAVLPLLNNLKKDADTNPYIHWPNRAEKINEFIAKLNTILEG